MSYLEVTLSITGWAVSLSRCCEEDKVSVWQSFPKWFSLTEMIPCRASSHMDHVGPDLTSDSLRSLNIPLVTCYKSFYKLYETLGLLWFHSGRCKLETVSWDEGMKALKCKRDGFRNRECGLKLAMKAIHVSTCQHNSYRHRYWSFTPSTPCRLYYGDFSLTGL